MSRPEAGSESMLEEWTAPPPMSTKAPEPAVLSSGRSLWLAYRIARDPHHCSVIRFDGIERYAWGPPPASLGVESPGDLPQGSFYEVLSPGRDEAGCRWLVTFPDALLEVRATAAHVVLRAAAAVAPAHALAALLPEAGHTPGG